MILALPARAKLNLELHVTGRRDDGYHDVETLLQAVDLHDLLITEPSDATTLQVSGLAVEIGEPNLVLRAARALEAAAGHALPARFELIKRIPAGAGLGGGSSDAAAALTALGRIYGLDLDLATIAAGLGADVPFFLRGGAARASGRGDVLSPASPAKGCFAIAWPGYPVPTAAVYAAWNQTGGEGDNELEAAARHVEPRLAEFARRLGPGWRMTGSGSAMFRSFDTCREARAAVAQLDVWTAVTRPVAGT